MNDKRAPLIAGAVALVLAILLIVFLVLPKMHAVDEAKTTLSAAEAQQATLGSQLQALQQAQNDADANRAVIENVQRQIPPTADEPGFILLLSNAATRAGIKLWQFTPATPTFNAATGLTEIPVTFTVKGNYFALAEFLFNLETLPRVAKVQTATIASAGADGTTTTIISSVPFLQMTGSVTLYTTDAAAGPGSQPGPTDSSQAAATAPVAPVPTSPAPGA